MSRRSPLDECPKCGVPHGKTCPVCDGDGLTDDPCSACNDKGFTHAYLLPCKECGICQECDGTGWVEKEEEDWG